jgi:hypothetical protein
LDAQAVVVMLMTLEQQAQARQEARAAMVVEAVVLRAAVGRS